ncbi:hypothetical protein EFV65_23270, partial [Yersinia enterocolitica]|nr:hypothetical protein [Yersinia enterocolitica]
MEKPRRALLICFRKNKGGYDREREAGVIKAVNEGAVNLYKGSGAGNAVNRPPRRVKISDGPQIQDDAQSYREWE